MGQLRGGYAEKSLQSKDKQNRLSLSLRPLAFDLHPGREGMHAPDNEITDTGCSSTVGTLLHLFLLEI
jgi:hypothetical protein